jgi:signal transduction histidine kinase
MHLLTKHPRQALLTGLLLLAGLAVRGQEGGGATVAFPPLVVLTDTARAYVLGDRVALLEDPPGTLSLDEVRARAGQFRTQPRPVPSYGATSSAVWAAFRVHNATHTDWYLEIGVPYVPEVDFYRQAAGDAFEVERLGDSRPYLPRAIRTNQMLFPLRVPPGGYGTYYLRFRSDHALGFPLRAATLPVFYESNQRRDLLNGGYFGLLGTLMLYNLFVFLSLRDRAYLYYVLCVGMAGLNVAYQHGYAFQFLWPHLPALNTPMLFAALATLCILLFTDAFLETARYAPRLRRLHWPLAGLALLILLLTLTGHQRAGFRVQAVLSLLMVGYVLAMGVAAYRKGFAPARYYLLGFGCLYLGVAVFVLKDVHVLPYNDLTMRGMQLGSAVEVVVLSYALVAKFNRYRHEKEQAQAEALRQAKAFSGQLIGTQEGERKRIAAELHDSVGQSLGLIKNRLLLLQHGPGPIAPSSLAEVTRAVGEALQEVRTISYGLRPVQIDLWGLSQAIRALVGETAGASQVRFYEEIDDVDGLFSKEAEINLYRIVQESLHNMIKHAQATEGRVLLGRQGAQVVLRIEDNGRGITGAAHKGGAGLVGFRERVNLLGGHLSLGEASPKGTIIHITVPITPRP